MFFIRSVTYQDEKETDEEKIGNRLGGGVRVPKPCRKRHKSKDWNFLHRNYIPKFFSTPTKNIFSSSILKIKIKLTKVENDQKSSRESLMILDWIFDHFQLLSVFFKGSSSKKYFLSELRKKLGYSFDVESSNLLIYDVFNTFWTL